MKKAVLFKRSMAGAISLILALGGVPNSVVADESSASEEIYEEAAEEIVTAEEDEPLLETAPGDDADSGGDILSLGLVEEVGEESSLELNASNIQSQFGSAKALTMGTFESVNPTVPRYYKFTSPETAVYEFYTLSNEGDPFIRIFDADGNFLRENDDFYDEGVEGQQGLDSYLRITIDSGITYYIMAYVYSGSESYILNVAKYSDDGDDIDEYRTKASDSGDLKLWKISPAYQEVSVNQPVTLKVGWSVPGNATPSFSWTVDGQAVAGSTDTLTYIPRMEGSEYTIQVQASTDSESETEEFYIETTHSHSYGAWVTDRAATALAAGSKHRDCTVCGERQTQSIPKLAAFINLNVAGKLPMKTKQKTNKVTAQLQTGDYITSWTSSNEKVVTVDAGGTLKAKKKTGKATITVKTAAGATASFVVAVQKKKVATKKVSVAARSITLTKGQTFDLQTEVAPITNQDKVSYKLSKKGVAKVSKGIITAKKKGKTVITVQSGKKKVKVKVTVK